MTRRWRGATLIPIAILAFGDKLAFAESPSDAAGDAPNALPGIVRVGVAGNGERIGIGAAATAGYGFTESVVGDSDKSHRVFGSVATSYRANDWFAAALRVDGRYDWHSNVPGGDGGGGVGEPSLLFRAGTARGDLRVGAEAGLGLPGEQAPSLTLSAISPEMSLLGAYAPSSGAVTVASRVGYRLDRSAETVSDPSRLQPGDRVSIGVSDTNALLLGAGLVARASKDLELLAEWTWDLRVPSKGATALQSPMRFDAGARYSTSETLALTFAFEASASSRPPVAPGSPLVAIEPRVAAFVGVSLRPKRPEPVVLPAAPRDDTAPKQEAAIVSGLLRGRVTDEGGHPIGGVKVHIGKADAGTETTTDDQGQFEQASLPVGKTDVVVSAEGYREQTRTVDVAAAQPAVVDIQLERALPVGQIRGLARSFSGEAIRATVRIDPIGKETVVAQGGKFEIDVPPGEYDVIVKAPGYADQRRHVRVEANGVVVLDLDMRVRR